MSKRSYIDLTNDDDINESNKKMKSESWFDLLLDEYRITWTLLQSVQLIINSINTNSYIVPVNSTELVQRNNKCLDEINCNIESDTFIIKTNQFCHAIHVNCSFPVELTWCIEQYNTKQTIVNLLNQIGDHRNLLEQRNILNQIGDHRNLLEQRNILNQIGDHRNLLEQRNILNQIGDHRNFLEQRNILNQIGDHRNFLEQRNLYYFPSLVDFTFDQLQQHFSDVQISSDHLGFNQVLVPFLENRKAFDIIPIISSFLGICHKELLPHILYRYKLLEAVQSIIEKEEAVIEYFNERSMYIFRQDGEFRTRINWQVTIQHTSQSLITTMMEYLHVSWPQVIPRLATMLQ